MAPTTDERPGAPPSSMDRQAIISPPTLLPVTNAPVDLQFLATHGYLSLSRHSLPALFSAFDSLFPASTTFFAQSGEAKSSHARTDSKRDKDRSEEGWSCIPGEKEMITLRNYNRTPPALQSNAAAAWRSGGEFISLVLSAIASSLGLEHDDAFDGFMQGEVELLPNTTHWSNTLMRLFRYDRPNEPGPKEERKIVSQQHHDLGLLSLVVASSPGLECWNPESQQWFDIEGASDDRQARTGQVTATLLVGRTLSFLTRNQYVSGRHRVCVPPVRAPSNSEADALEASPYRYSVVLAFRPCLVFPVYTSNFETERTGVFPPGYQMFGEPAGILWDAVVRSHWNVNVGVSERDKQKAAIEKKKLEIMKSMQAQMVRADGSVE